MKRISYVLSRFAWLSVFLAEFVPALELEVPAPFMDDAELARMRGGLASPNDIQISFGFASVLRVNGELLAEQTLNVVDFSLSGRGDPQPDVNLYRVASGFAPGLAGASAVSLDDGLGIVLQNASDGQLIQQITRVDILIEGLPMTLPLSAVIGTGS